MDIRLPGAARQWPVCEELGIARPERAGQQMESACEKAL